MRPYRKPHEVLQMTVSNNPVAGAADIQFAIGDSSLGAMLVASSDKGICAILIGADPDALVRDLQERFRGANLLGGGAEFQQLVARIVAFLEAPKSGLELALDVRGTQFQQRVWKALQEIPVGSTASYTDIAKQFGAPSSVRAVAQACGANPIAVAIPCHRVVRNDGALSGYRWGVERKRVLLEREAAR
jgi:AraC family transcriptional regulator of adaptative response/methylated-DNA-[protein]-cysteine methyltransferase